MNEEGHSWESILGVIVVLYWGVYFMVKFFTFVKEDTLVLFLFFCVIVGLLMRFVIRWVKREIVLPTLPVEDGTVPKDQPLPFFVKGQVRRRKLDLTRSSNFIKDSVSTKQKRQLSGILRKRKKKGGR